MAKAKKPRYMFEIRADDKGAVLLNVHAERKLFWTARLTPPETSSLTSGLLSEAYKAFEKTGETGCGIPPDGRRLPIIPVSSMGFVNSRNEGHETLTVTVGEVNLGFALSHGRIRKLSRFLSASMRQHLSAAALLLEPLRILGDFLFALWGWGGVVSARMSAVSRRLAISFWSRISGRSFRPFRSISLNPADPEIKYEPINGCIYCNAEVYSKKTNDPDEPFGDEHIIPEGLGGTLVLPDASCERCELETGLKVEGKVLGRTLIALRYYLGLRPKRPKPMLLEGADFYGKKIRVPDAPIEHHPVLFNMVAYATPAFVAGRAPGFPADCGYALVEFKYDADLLLEKYQIKTYSTPIWDSLMVGRMLAKIGHSLAVAELGQQAFTPLLLELIRNGTENDLQYVGGEADISRYRKSDNFHEATLGYQKIRGKTYVVAKIRLFAKHDGPIYYTVVGKALESRMAAFNRVLRFRTSSMRRR